MMKNPAPKPAFTWDYWGECDPAHSELTHYNPTTFSVGVFQWLPKSNGKGVKRGKVVKRITGYVDDPQEVYDKAREFIESQENLANE